MMLNRRTLLGALGAATLALPGWLSGCASAGARVAPFESNASFTLMLYG